MRFESRQSGAACSAEYPWPSRSSACWRASKLYDAPGTHQPGSTVSVPPQSLQMPRRTRIQSWIPSCAGRRRRAVTDDGHLPASRTLARQPLALRLAGLAFFAGTWDKDDHG